MEAGESHVGRGLVVISEQKGQEGHKVDWGVCVLWVGRNQETNPAELSREALLNRLWCNQGCCPLV